MDDGNNLSGIDFISTISMNYKLNLTVTLMRLGKKQKTILTPQENPLINNVITIQK
jgi:hypothetical protein